TWAQIDVSNQSTVLRDRQGRRAAWERRDTGDLRGVRALLVGALEPAPERPGAEELYGGRTRPRWARGLSCAPASDQAQIPRHLVANLDRRRPEQGRRGPLHLAHEPGPCPRRERGRRRFKTVRGAGQRSLIFPPWRSVLRVRLPSRAQD